MEKWPIMMEKPKMTNYIPSRYRKAWRSNGRFSSRGSCRYGAWSFLVILGHSWSFLGMVCTVYTVHVLYIQYMYCIYSTYHAQEWPRMTENDQEWSCAISATSSWTETAIGSSCLPVSWGDVIGHFRLFHHNWSFFHPFMSFSSWFWIIFSNNLIFHQ